VPDVFVLIPLAGMAVGALFMVGIYRLAARWMDRRHGTPLPEGTREELDDLRRQVAAVEELPERVAELEERLDFAERMLARRERQPLPGPE
jgi:hypothetical protein